jgi:hypothetical protein
MKWRKIFIIIGLLFIVGVILELLKSPDQRKHEQYLIDSAISAKKLQDSLELANTLGLKRELIAKKLQAKFASRGLQDGFDLSIGVPRIAPSTTLYTYGDSTNIGAVRLLIPSFGMLQNENLIQTLAFIDLFLDVTLEKTSQVEAKRLIDSLIPVDGSVVKRLEKRRTIYITHELKQGFDAITIQVNP